MAQHHVFMGIYAPAIGSSLYQGLVGLFYCSQAAPAFFTERNDTTDTTHICFG